MKVAHIILHILSVREVPFSQPCVEANVDVRLQWGCQHSTEMEGVDVVPRRPREQCRQEWKTKGQAGDRMGQHNPSLLVQKQWIWDARNALVCRTMFSSLIFH